MSNQTKNLRNWVVIGIAVLSIFWFAFDYKEKEATAEQVITIEDEQLGYGFPTANVLRVQDNEFIYYVDKSDGTRYDFILGDTASETAPFLFDASTSSTHIEILTINNLYTLPTADGNASDVIITDGSGVLSWTAQSGGTTSDQFWYAVGTTGMSASTTLPLVYASTTETDYASITKDLTVSDDLYIDDDANAVIIGSTTPEYTKTFIAYGSSTDPLIQMWWDTDKIAFRGGKRDSTDWDDVNVGEGSFSWGSQTTASGLYSVALGYNNWATGNYSIALGYGAASSGYQAISLGDTNDASGYHSIAMSAQALASGQGSIAIGDYNTASATNSLAIGYGNTAVGTYSFSAGYKSQSGDASGDTGAISVGYYADALNETSMAIGTYISTTADGAMTFGSGADQDNPLINSNASSLAVGFSSTTATMIVQDGNTSTTGDFQADDYLFVDSTNEAVVIASSTPLYTKTLIAYGSSTNEDIQMFWDGNKGAFRGGLRYSTFWDDASVGEYSFAFGSKARASGDGSIAIGGSTASQWFDTTASGKESVAIGGRATASGIISIAMGYEANATSDYSVAIGRGNDAIKYAAAIGYGNNASGEASSAFGRGNISSGMNSTAIGKSNTSSGFESIAVGAYSQANHVLSVAVGGHSITDGKSSLAVGIYAKAGTDGSDYGATAIGYYADALENESIAIGTYISSTGDGSIVLGSGVATDDPLVNSTADSLAIGLASTTATLTVKDGYVSTTGDLSVDEDLYVVGTLYGGSPLDIGSAVSTTGDMSVSADLYADGVLVVPVKTTTGHPASPVNGQIYVNTFDNNFYGYADGDWRELSGAWLGIYQPEEEQTIQYLPEEKKFDWAYLIIPIFLLELFRAIKYLIKKLKIYEN